MNPFMKISTYNVNYDAIQMFEFESFNLCHRIGIHKTRFFFNSPYNSDPQCNLSTFNLNEMRCLVQCLHSIYKF